MDFDFISKIKNQNPQRQYEGEIDVLELEDVKHHIVVYNDDVNTFDFVIETLMEVCDHTPEQAEQCTWLIHFKGKCEVKSGNMEDLLPRHQKLLSRGLTSEII